MFFLHQFGIGSARTGRQNFSRKRDQGDRLELILNRVPMQCVHRDLACLKHPMEILKKVREIACRNRHRGSLPVTQQHSLGYLGDSQMSSQMVHPGSHTTATNLESRTRARNPWYIVTALLSLCVGTATMITIYSDQIAEIAQGVIWCALILAWFLFAAFSG